MNTTKAITQEIYDRIRKVDQVETTKALPEDRQVLFTKLCRLQQEGNNYYQLALERITKHLHYEKILSI